MGLGSRVRVRRPRALQEADPEAALLVPVGNRVLGIEWEIGF